MDRSPPVQRSVRFDVEDYSIEEDGTSEEESPPLSSPPPRTPSPTRSGSTVSSGGPLTPPSPGFTVLIESKGTSPVHHSAGRPKLNPLLASGLVLFWDMAEDPSKLTALNDAGSEVAASISPGRPLRQMILVNDSVEDWPLNLRQAVHEDSGDLTVGDVLSTLHHHLLKLVARQHFEAQEPKRIQEITSAYQARLERWPKSGEGVRRIDYLSGRVFQRLSVLDLHEASGLWQFKFDVI